MWNVTAYQEEGCVRFQCYVMKLFKRKIGYGLSGIVRNQQTSRYCSKSHFRDATMQNWIFRDLLWSIHAIAIYFLFLLHVCNSLIEIFVQ
jgi:hypothetical protein